MLKITAILTCAALACGANNPCNLPAPPAYDVPSGSIGVQGPAAETPSVDAYAQEVVRLVNAERANAGLAPLVLDAALSAAAQVRAEEIDVSFSHTRPDGRNSFTVLKEMGITYRAVGENIAKGSPTPQRVVQGWMGSAGHRANILNKNFTTIGIGIYEDSLGVMHWVQLFTA